MVGFGLFLGKFKRFANSKGELASELCYTGPDLSMITYPCLKKPMFRISNQTLKLNVFFMKD